MTSHSERRRSSRIKEDYYETLEITRDATDEEIKQSYRQLALKYHPDKNTDPDATNRFQAIGKAYKILGDPKLRSTYDLLGAQATDLIEHYHYEEYPATFTDMTKCQKVVFGLVFLLTVCGCGCFCCCFCCGGCCCCKCFCKCFCNNCFDECCCDHCCDHWCGKCRSNKISVRTRESISIQRQQPTDNTNNQTKF